MDTDSLPSAPVFLAFVLVFSYLSLVQHSRALAKASERNDRPSRFYRLTTGLTSGPTFLFWPRTASVFAIVLSGIALIRGVATTEWWPISLMALGVLGGLFALDRLSALAAARNPHLAFPWNRSPAVASGQPGNGTNGGGSNGGGGLDGALSWEADSPAITEEELTSLDDRDREMLRSILRLDVTTVREIMVPRLDMDVVEADTPLEDVAATIMNRGHSRIPVFEETIDRIIGIVHGQDLLGALASPEPGNTLRKLVRPAFFIPETKRVDDLLEEFQERQTQIAMVVDEYGGTEGLVTMEDVLEEIVGEIEDEFSRSRESQIVREADGGVLVDARVTTEDVEGIFGTEIDSSEVDTVGGLVYHSLGRIPQAGDVVETDHLRIEVVSILGRRLRRLRINRIDQKAAEPGS